MRKLGWFVVAVVVLAIAAYLLWPSRGGKSDEVAARTSPSARMAVEALEWQAPPVPAQELAQPGGTPPLRNPATDADGHFEVEVVAGAKPVAGARVRAYLQGPHDASTGQLQWRFAGGGATGPDGKIRFAARPGAYLLAARAEGFAVAQHAATRPSGEALTRVQLFVERGETLRGRTVERGSLAEVPMAELTIRVAGDRLWRRRGVPAEERVYASSDSRGRFEVSGLAPATYLVEAAAAGRAPGAASVRLPRGAELVIELGAASFIEGHVIGSDGKPASGATVTAVGADDPVVAVAGAQGDFSAEVNQGAHQLSASSGGETGALPDLIIVGPGTTVRDVVIRLGKGAAIAGVVEGSRGPVEGAALSLSPHDRMGDSGRATSGPDGRFAIERLAPGSYDLEARADGYTGLERRGVTVAAGQRFELKLELEGTGAVEGVVRDSGGAPVADAVVQGGLLWGGPFVSGAPAQARTDAQGRYRLAGLEVGTARISAGRVADTWLALQMVNVAEGEAAKADFVLPDSGVVSGRVTRKSGGPLDRAVDAYAFPNAERIGSGDIRTCPVGADGRYRLELPPGDYSLVALYTGEGKFTGAQAGVHVEPRGSVEQDLVVSEPPEPVLSGHVLEAGGGPSVDAVVVVQPASGPISRPVWASMTDDSGRFDMMPSEAMTASSYVVFARNGGRDAAPRTVRTGTRDAVLDLRPPASIAGRLLNAAGVTSFRLRVETLDALGPFTGSAEQEYAGDTFELHDVPAVAVRVSVATDDGRSGHADLTLSPGERSEVSIALEAGAAIHGRAVRADGTPLSVAMAVLDGRTFSDPSGPDGRFALANLPAGTSDFEVRAPWMQSASKRITLAAGQKLEVGDVVLTAMKADPGTIGASFGEQPPDVVIASALPAGPADVAGIRVGDVLVFVDAQPVRSVAEARALTAGAPGTPVKLTLRRQLGQVVVEILRAP